MTIIAITGGRREGGCGPVLFPSLHQLNSFWELATHLKITTLVHGHAIGTDRTVAEFIENRNRGWETVAIHPPIPHWELRRLAVPDPRRVEIIPYPVDIRVDGPWPGAGHKRNGRMLRESRAEVLVAFPGGAGTDNCVEQAIDRGRGRITVYRWRGEREEGLGEFVKIYGTMDNRI